MTSITSAGLIAFGVYVLSTGDPVKLTGPGRDWTINNLSFAALFLASGVILFAYYFWYYRIEVSAESIRRYRFVFKGDTIPFEAVRSVSLTFPSALYQTISVFKVRYAGGAIPINRSLYDTATLRAAGRRLYEAGVRFPEDLLPLLQLGRPT